MAKNCKIKITVNQPVVTILENASIEAIVGVGDAIQSDLKNSGTMPFNTGNMQNNSTYLEAKDRKSGRVQIVTATPYARRLYFHPEYNYRRTHNRKAGGRWFDRFVNDQATVDKMAKKYGQFFKKKAGGVVK